MNAALDDGYGGYLVLAGIAILAHEPWRWLGFLLGRDVDAGSEVFLWVRAVATALVAGLVMKLVLVPAGSLAAVPLSARVLAMTCAIAVYMASGRRLAVGVAVGSLLLLAMEWLRATR